MQLLSPVDYLQKLLKQIGFRTGHTVSSDFDLGPNTRVLLTGKNLI